jgi:uncharacterized protein (UPF0548 family)
MSGFSFTPVRPCPAKVDEFVREQARLAVTYADVGATRDGLKTAGFHYDHWNVPLGSGDAGFERAKEGLREWAAHADADVNVTPSGAPLAPGQTVALVVRTAGLYMLAACQIVWTVDDAHNFGFAYGTLPGHPECGEEAFVIQRADDGSVSFDITAISRPTHLLARLGGPVTRMLQIRTTRGYLEAMQTWVGSG